MSYNTGEAALLTRIIALSDYSADNAVRNNWKVLSSGASDHYAILKPFSMALEWHSFSAYTVRWRTVVEIWERYTLDGTTQSNLATYASAILGVLSYPHLGEASILDANIVEFREPQEMWSKDGGVVWLKWDIIVEWSEQTEVSFAE